MSGFQPPNYTQIPNEVFDVWMHRLTPAEFKVLLCICRKTFGFHKSEDKISFNQLASITGLHKRGIQNNIKSLIEHGLIIKINSKTKSGDFDSCKYKINVNFCKKDSQESEPYGEELSSKQVWNSVPEGVELSSQKAWNSVPEGVEPNTNTKETLTKERLKKNIAQSRSASEHEQRSDLHFSSSSGCFEGIEKKDVEEWKEAFPEIVVQREIVKAQQWLKANPSKAKKKLWRKFLIGWFTRANEKEENRKAYRSQNYSEKVDRRTRDIDGNPVDSPADGLF